MSIIASSFPNATMIVGIALNLCLLAPQAAKAMPAVSQDSLATITTDTGAFAPGPTSFARFTVPGLCRAGAFYTSTVQRRTRLAQGVLDTIRQTAPERDTLPAQAVTLARNCGVRFTVNGTPVAELTDLFALALQSGNDTLAQAVVRRQLALAATPASRDTVLLAAMSGYLTAEPARVRAAETIAAQADALGATAPILRLMVHDSLLAFANSTYDTDRMQAEAKRLIALGQSVPISAIQYDYDPIVRAYEALLALAFVMHPDSIAAVAAEAKHDLSRFPPGKNFPIGKSYSGEEVLDYKTATLDAVLRELSPLGADQLAVGQAPTPLRAGYWFPKGAHGPSGTAPLSLVVYAGHGPCLGGINGWSSYNLCGWNNLGDGVYTAIAHYAALGLPITIVVETWRSALGQLPASVIANADTLRWYYQDHLKLPVTVAVVVDSLQQLPAPDGRLFPCDADARLVCWDRSANAQRYLDQSRPVLLLGKKGELLYSGGFQYADGQSRTFAPLFEAILRHRLAVPSSPLSSTDVPGGSHSLHPAGGPDVTR